MGRIPGWQTQAVYHAVAELMTEETPDTIIISQPSDTYVCLGYHQKLDHVFDRKVVKKKEFPFYVERLAAAERILIQINCSINVYFIKTVFLPIQIKCMNKCLRPW
jgi:hypothetical protein